MISNNMNNIITSFEGLKQNTNVYSRMEGQGPLTHQNNKNLSDNIAIKEHHQNFRQQQDKTITTNSYRISHKRSVSDELFNKIVPTHQIAHQIGVQIPLKINKQKL